MLRALNNANLQINPDEDVRTQCWKILSILNDELPIVRAKIRLKIVIPLISRNWSLNCFKKVKFHLRG